MRLLMTERDEGRLRFEEVGQVRAGGVGATRELVCMYGPDVEYYAVPAGMRTGAAGDAAREANFPLVDRLAVRLQRGRDGGRGVVVTPAETLQEYARGRAGAALVSPATLVEGLARGGCLPHAAAVLLVASTWATLVIYEGRAVADVRSDRIPTDPEGRAGSLRALAALQGGAGSPGGVVVVTAAADAEIVPARLPMDRASLRLDELLGTGCARLRPDFIGPKMRRRRAAGLALPVAALLGMGAFYAAGAGSDDPGPAEPSAEEGTAIRVSERPAPVAASGAGDGHLPAPEVPAAPGDPVQGRGFPAAASEIAADPAVAPTAAEVVQPDAAPAEPPPAPEPRFAFAGVGVSSDGGRVWYFVDGATRRVVAVGESGEVDE